VNFRSFSTLQIALGVSIAVHAVLLTVRFVDPEGFNRIFQDTPLEVILVNAKTRETRPGQGEGDCPAHAGGRRRRGEGARHHAPAGLGADRDGRLPGRRPAQDRGHAGAADAAAGADPPATAALPPPDPKQPSNTPEAVAREERRRQLFKLLAEIERRVNEENARPKKRYISPATREEVYAVYYDRLRRKIEDKGTENFPTAAGRKLYGELTMILTVNRDGRVIDVEVVQTSGSLTLDRRAMAIARSAAPFGRFNEAMRRQADQIVVVSRFRFTRDETLETNLTSR
jgi:protein TonB